MSESVKKKSVKKKNCKEMVIPWVLKIPNKKMYCNFIRGIELTSFID